MSKTTLWAGPEDGLDVEIGPEQTEFHVKGPLKMTPENVILGEEANLGGEQYIGVYELNPATSRFEWKGYR